MWLLLIVLAFVFVISYDPKSGTLNKYVEYPPAQCKEGHYQEIQFAQKGYQCPENNKTKMGAIIST
jgi:hypothetical protein